MPVEHYERLLACLRAMKRIAVAFSGGVDSSLLLAAAHEAVGESALAVTALSPLVPSEEIERAMRIAARLGVRVRTVSPVDLADPVFRSNRPDRCYHCKKKIFSAILDVAREEGIECVVEGSNTDDLGDYRPGLRALRELGIRSPYLELRISKRDIRDMAREKGLENWNTPSAACLASRIPYGEAVTRERLERIARAEVSLRTLGFSQLRVRDHGDLARIEFMHDDFALLVSAETRNAVTRLCRDAGYRYVTLDLEGYRTGSLNEVLASKEEA